MTESKNFTTTLVLDYKNSKFRVIASKRFKQSKLKHTEIPIHVSLDVSIPDTPVLKVNGEVKMSQTQLANIALSELGADDD